MVLNEAIGREGSVTATESRAALTAVLASPYFRRSLRLRKFLSYVVERSLEDEDLHLTEQQIGIALFERRPSYDTAADNIVRVNASEMRKRLELYYAEEGATDPVVLEIPRGAYQPLFQRRVVPVESLPEVAAAVVEPLPVVAESVPRDLARVVLASHEAGGVSRRSVWTTAALAFLLIGAVGVAAVQTYRIRLFQQQMEPWQTGTALQAFWSNFFRSKLDTDIVLADTSFAVAQDLSGYRLTLNDYLQQTYQHDPEKLVGSEMDQKTAKAVFGLVSSRNSGSMSDFRTARRIVGLNPTSASVQVRFAREFTGEALRHDSVVLIGSSRSNPWVGPFQPKLFYRMKSAANAGAIQVEVVQPQKGEASVYSTSSDPNRTDGFCMIAYLPSLGGEGKTLIIAGTDSQATEAGGDFMTQESSLEELQQRLGVGLNAGSFQLLLRTSRVVGSPLTTEIVSVRRGSL